MNLAGKTVLITGAAGFIGSNLAKLMLQRQAKVIGTDNLSTGQETNIEHLASAYPDEWQFIEADIRDASVIQQILETAQPYITIHLAALASVQLSMSQPLLANDINVNGFINVLQASQEQATPYFFYASSSAIYGDQHSFPIVETASTMPLSVYGVTKLMNEAYAKVLNKQPTKCIGMRLFNVFGPNQLARSDYAAVIPKWIELLKAGEKITIFGDGSATRDFCYVDNIGAFIESVLHKSDLPPNTIFNVGSGTAISLNELSSAIVTALGSNCPKPQIQYSPWRPNDVMHSYADLSYAKNMLGYTANIDLKTGLKKLLAHD